MVKAVDETRWLTEAGTVVYSLMLESGVRTLVELGDMMEDPEGNPVPNKNLSRWLRGVNSPPDWFGREVVRALDLDGEKKDRLGIALAFGSDVKKAPAGAFRSF